MFQFTAPLVAFMLGWLGEAVEVELYSSMLQEILIFQVQLMPEVEAVETMAEMTPKLEQEEEVLVGPLYFKVQM